MGYPTSLSESLQYSLGNNDLFSLSERELTTFDERVRKFRKASIERNMAIRARQRKRWASLEDAVLTPAEQRILVNQARAAFNVTEEQNQWCGSLVCVCVPCLRL